VLRFLGEVTLSVLRPSGVSAGRVLEQLAEPFDSHPRATATPERLRGTTRDRERSDRDDWRKVLWLPFAGPVVLTGFFGGMVNMFVLGPLLSLAFGVVHMALRWLGH
jgi:hypothetical protein